MPQANANINTIEINGALVVDISNMPLEQQGKLEASSRSSPDVAGELIANVSSKALNSVSSTNVSSSSTVEVSEGQDVILTFMTESYPPIRSQRWTKLSNSNNSKTVYQESYTASGCRLAHQKLQASIICSLPFCVVSVLLLHFVKVVFLTLQFIKVLLLMLQFVKVGLLMLKFVKVVLLVLR